MCTPTAATARLLQIVAVAAVGASNCGCSLMRFNAVQAKPYKLVSAANLANTSAAKKARPARIVQNYGPQRIFRILSTQIVQFIKLLRASRRFC